MLLLLLLLLLLWCWLSRHLRDRPSAHSHGWLPTTTLPTTTTNSLRPWPPPPSPSRGASRSRSRPLRWSPKAPRASQGRRRGSRSCQRGRHRRPRQHGRKWRSTLSGLLQRSHGDVTECTACLRWSRCCCCNRCCNRCSATACMNAWLPSAATVVVVVVGLQCRAGVVVEASHS
jgi:hypothetical protein